MAELQFDVAAVGNAIVDVIAQSNDDQLQSLGLSKGHMQLIEEGDVKRLYAEMGPAREVSGGSAANTVVGVASLGGKAAFFGRVAADSFGEIFRHDIRASGVAFDNPAMGDGDPTARSLIFVTPDGERTMMTYLGISPELSSTDIDASVIEASACLYLEGYLYDEPLAMDAFHRAAEVATNAGRRVSLTLSDAFCVDRHRAAFSTFISKSVDVLFANEAELKSLAQVEDFDAALERVAQDVALLAVTRGNEGCAVVADGSKRTDVRPERSVSVVDTTGAGDLFASGFLYALSRGADPELCARYGNLCAGEIITAFGARPNTSLADLARTHGLEL